LISKHEALGSVPSTGRKEGRKEREKEGKKEGRIFIHSDKSKKRPSCKSI
jgi:hypothetical protein